jgi:hypothetical protein
MNAANAPTRGLTPGCRRSPGPLTTEQSRLQDRDVVGPIVAELGQARRYRGARVLELLGDAQARVPGLVPNNALLLRDRGL